jgi:NADPH:quinone reductase-like Zn-dependent oxidoreductase
MRAVLMTAVGGPEVLEVAEVPEPEITGQRDVRVRLRAAGINPVDYKLRSSGTIGGSLSAISRSRLVGEVRTHNDPSGATCPAISATRSPIISADTCAASAEQARH